MNSHSLIDKSCLKKGALVVGVYQRTQDSKTPVSSQEFLLQRGSVGSVQEDLDELVSLLETLQIPTLDRVVQNKDRSGGIYYLGRGKMEEVRDLARESDAGLVAIDGELTGSQIRAIEALTQCQVIDREGIILEIFSQHASTSVARIQVEMARWQYLMPRLVGAWSHFSRQAGGGVKSKGMGEKQIEIDRRLGRARIAKLRKKLDHIQTESREQRKKRSNLFKVALVGYTNSGKTTLMEGLSSSSKCGEDQLFATLSARVKKMNPVAEPPILFTDTVGFIGRLPMVWWHLSCYISRDFRS